MATRLVSARWVLPIIAPPIHEGAVVLDDQGTILAVGPRSDVRAGYPALAEQRSDGALLPGLVNAHTHLELSALAGRVPGGAGFVPWASALMAVAHDLQFEAKRDAARAAASAMVAAGTSAVGDVANALDHVDVIGEVGLRGLVFHELVGSREARTGDALADAERERLHFLDHEPWPDGVGYVPAPHAPYSAGSELLRRIFIAAAATPHPTAVHVAEDPDEITLLRHGTGRWAPILAGLGVVPGSRTPGLAPVAYLASLGAFAGPRPPLLVHMVHASAEDRDLARQHRAPVVLCPRSNLHIGGRLPDVPALLAAGLVVALGTDGLASTPDPSLWGEIAALSERFADVNPEVWLRAATLGGAHALGLPMLGALAPGLRPGVISVAILDVAAPLLSLVRAAQPSIEWISRP